MEGVLVTAKKDGGTIAITVVSDDKGRYSFPSTKLSPGSYTLKIRAVGYEIDGPKTAEVAAGKAATVDIKLKPTKNISAQLSNAEWLSSLPGTEDQHKFLYSCGGCHTVERILKSSHDSDEFLN